jgi:hypothetical protein
LVDGRGRWMTRRGGVEAPSCWRRTRRSGVGSPTDWQWTGRVGVGARFFTVLAVPLRSVVIDRFAINTDSPSTKRGAKYVSFGWIIGPKGVSRVQRSEDLATSAQILCRWISKAFTDPSGQPRLAQESWRARRGPARQSNPSRICWRCSDSFLAPSSSYGLALSLWTTRWLSGV